MLAPAPVDTVGIVTRPRQAGAYGEIGRDFQASSRLRSEPFF